MKFALMSDDSTGDDRIRGPSSNPLVERLAGELIAASGHYGLGAPKLNKAPTLLALQDVRRTMDQDHLTAEESALHLIQERVDAWPDDRARAILRSALGFDHATARGRTNRLDLTAIDLNAKAPTRKQEVTADFLDTIFTSRLARDLATELLAAERNSSGSRVRPLVLVVAGVLLLGVVALGALLIARDDGQGDDLIFRPVPQRCSIEVCNTEASAIEARTGGFTGGDFVNVLIVVPSGENANDLGGVYAYQDELAVDDDGSFTWRYWWDPGMATGTYEVRITDLASGQFVDTSFEFFNTAPK